MTYNVILLGKHIFLKNKISLLFYFFIFCGFSQELPPIQNYTTISYGAGNQNWSITQTKDKNIYSANNSGLLKFNGASWELYGTPNGSILRSVNAVNNRIYSGCYMEFGFWEENNLGNLEYNSLSESSKISLIEDEQFWNIIAYKEWVLFQSLQRIYVYNVEDDTISTIESPTDRAKIFKVNGSIYYQKINEGVFKIENGKPAIVTADPIITQNTVVGAFFVNDKVTFLLENGLFYSLENNQLTPWKTEVEDLNFPIKVYSSLHLSDGGIAIGTISNGLFQIDKHGKLINVIDQENGLNNNTVLSIFQDEENNLWLALDNGISVINIDTPFKEYIDKIGKLGRVYTAIEFDGYLYLGTNQGLFYKVINSKSAFSIIPNTKGQVWSLKEIYGTLFCGHNNGTYTVRRERAKLISTISGTWDIKTLPGNSNLLLQGHYQGLSVLEKKNDVWSLRNKIEGFEIATRFYEWVDKKQLIVNHENKGVFIMQFDEALEKVTNIIQQDPMGIGASLIKYNDAILYASNLGIYKYDWENKEFNLNKSLTSDFFNDKESLTGILIADHKQHRLWGFTNSAILSLSPSQFNSKHEVVRVPIPISFRKNMGVLGFESITPIEKNKYLIGTADGYVTLDMDKLTYKEYQIKINAIEKQTSEFKKQRISLQLNPELVYKENSLTFSYSVQEYDKYTEPTYQYQLLGLHESWSSWSKHTSVSFENLPFGEYTFKVKASLHNVETQIVSKDFVIDRPWYLSYVAIVLYFISLVFVLIGVHKLSKRYYKRQQESILKENRRKIKRKEQKAKRKIIELSNSKLKDEIESKNRELAVSTMSIIKKNEFLNVVKTQLVEAKTPQQIKGVLRTIDRNINNADDWKVFEEAFNNADKDFLKKVKEIHPDLTSNDLRLCAYLRLNLSSKEIAPLLNISGRSVEVKRYRLRKKMGLEHEKGLADYILDL